MIQRIPPLAVLVSLTMHWRHNLPLVGETDPIVSLLVVRNKGIIRDRDRLDTAFTAALWPGIVESILCIDPLSVPPQVERIPAIAVL